ncbi:MAG: metallophosphoesterase [Myxococcota bacterium]
MPRHAALVALLLLGCRPTIAEPPPEQRLVVDRPAETVSFAVIGDFGLDSPEEAAVATLVHGWSPDVVLTLGDNNYPNGASSTIDANIGKHYASFIAPYRGDFGPGGDENRFFPTLGNHDWRTWNIAPYLDYFELPGNERYYDFVWGPVHFFALDSDSSEPDGTEADSTQATWLRKTLAASTAAWRVVYMHHPPHSSGDHGSTRRMQWPFARWGADVIMAGHDHHYERIERDDALYIVNGLGGNPKRYGVGNPVEGSQVSYNDAHGALRVRADATTLSIEFVDTEGTVVDRVVRQKPGAEAPTQKPKQKPDPKPPEAPRAADFEAYED